jgi:hypothetical protein
MFNIVKYWRTRLPRILSIYWLLTPRSDLIKTLVKPDKLVILINLVTLCNGKYFSQLSALKAIFKLICKLAPVVGLLNI